MNLSKLIEIMKEDAPLNLKSKDSILEGLQILSKYSNNSTLKATEHEILYSISPQESIDNGITEEDVVQLKGLNWMLHEEAFACFT